MLKYTLSTLNRLQDLVKESGYILRYEKGSFKSGYCVLQDKKILVVNKYFETEARITCLLEILPLLQINKSDLSEANRKFLERISQSELILENPESNSNAA